MAGWFFAFWALLCLAGPTWAQGSYEQFFQALKMDNPRVLQGLKARGFDLNTRSDANEPPLVIALREGALRAADYLIAQPELDLDARSGKDENALMLAAIKGHAAQARELIRRKAQVNKPGWTPLHYAASSTGEQSPAIVELLLEHHAYIDAESPNRSTPLMLAAMYGNRDLVPLLLEEGADPSLRNDQGLTAVDFARRAERDDLAELIAQRLRQRRAPGR